jgi:hypothetical protein
MTLAGLPLWQVARAGAAPATGAADALSAEKLYPLFKDPSGLARPFVRWWWNGNRVNKGELLRELDVLKAAGIGGVEINPIEFPETADPMGFKGLDWLSDEWLDLLQAAILGAKERGIVCDLIVGSGWPFGGEFLAKDEQTQMLALGTRNLKGPKRYEFSRADLLKQVEPPVMSKRPQKSKELLLLRLSAARLEQFQAGVDLNAEIQKDVIQVDVPEGEHVLYFLAKLTGFESVIHGAPGASGPVLNHYSKAAVQKYLDRMSDALTRKLGPMGQHLRSLFVDSMELEGANWCDDMPEQFGQRRGYALAPYLPYILYKTGRMGRALDQKYGAELSGEAQSTVERVRYDFEVTRLELFRERFLDTFLAWCKKHGVQSRVQAYGREYFPLDSSLQVDIPECETWVRPETGEALKDWDYKEGRSYSQVNKFVASAARLTGKRLVSCEELTNTQVVFNATLEKLKIVADLSNLSGVTHSILHGFNYSPKEAAFPGWVRYGTFFNERNPWWPYFRRWTDYKARLSAVFQNTEAYADIAVLHPLADMWSRTGVPWDPNPERCYPAYVFNVWEALQQSGNSCDYVTELVLQNATFAKGQLAYGPRRYKTLLLIEVESIQPQTAEALRRFAEVGGRIVFIGKEPARAPGLAEHARRDKLVQDAMASLKQKHPERATLYPAPEPSKTMLEWVKGLQTRLQLAPYVRMEQPVSSVSQLFYQCPDADVFFIANYNLTQGFEFEAEFTTRHQTAWLWEPETGERRLYPTAGPGNKLRICLAPAESRLIVFDSHKAEGKAFDVPALHPAAAAKVAGTWSVELEHVDGTRRSVKLDTLVDFAERDELKAFAGVIWYELAVPIARPGDLGYLDLGKVHGVSEVVLNGRNLGVKWYGAHRYELAGAAKEGTNLLRVKVTTTLGNYMKSLTENKDGIKWMKKQPLYPVGLVGPVGLIARGRA